MWSNILKNNSFDKNLFNTLISKIKKSFTLDTGSYKKFTWRGFWSEGGGIFLMPFTWLSKDLLT